jgi:hypothetical protein
MLWLFGPGIVRGPRAEVARDLRARFPDMASINPARPEVALHLRSVFGEPPNTTREPRVLPGPFGSS